MMVKNTRQDRGKWKLMSTLSIERNSEKKKKRKRNEVSSARLTHSPLVIQPQKFHKPVTHDD